MSFGFSTGDFVGLLQIALRLRKEFADAPEHFKTISTEVRSLYIVLQDAEVSLSVKSLSQQQEKEVHELLTSCGEVLKDAEETVRRYETVIGKGGNMHERVRRAWKRVSFEPDDIREVRDRITSSISLLSNFVTRITSDAVFEVKNGVERLNLEQDDRARVDALNWLTQIDYSSQQKDNLRRRQPGTGEWLLKSPEYSTWLSSNGQTLFCPGIPGAGKTILTSIVVDDLTTGFRDDASVGIAFLYFNFRQKPEQENVDLLYANLLKQLARTRNPLPEGVADLEKSRNTYPSLSTILIALKSVLATYSKVFIVVDALDECQSIHGCREVFISNLLRLQTDYRVNVFATSRLIPDIAESFTGFPSLEIRASEGDVRRYLDGHLSQLPAFVRRSVGLQEEIKNYIVNAVDGMFLLAKLFLDSLQGKRSPKALRATMHALATGVEAGNSSGRAYDPAYDDAMARINSQLADQTGLAMETLCWISSALEPLSTAVLQHALATEKNSTELDEDNMPEIEDILSACAGLVAVDAESNIIRLVHYTTQEYFERTQNRWFPQAAEDITATCVAYLSFDVFRGGPCTSQLAYEERQPSFPLHPHAARNWGHHAKRATTIHPDWLELLGSGSRLDAMNQVVFPRWGSNVQVAPHRNFVRGGTGLHQAVHFDFVALARRLISLGADLDQRDDEGRTPLHSALGSNREVIVKMLIESGAEVVGSDKSNQTPLSLAAEHGSRAICELLLGRGAKHIMQGQNDPAPLSRVISSDNETMVQLFSENSIALEARHEEFTELLYLAVEEDNESTAQLFIDLGADMERRVDLYRNPLSIASEQGNMSMVQLLIRNGADVNSKNHRGETSLQRAVKYGGAAVVRELLLRGADINCRNRHGETLLDLACGIIEIKTSSMSIHALVGFGADLEHKNDKDRTPLSIAAVNGQLAAVQPLLDLGADLNSRDSEGRTALHHTAWNSSQVSRNANYLKIGQLLLDKGADLESRDIYGRTPISCASQKGSTLFFRLCLEKGADFHTREDSGVMPIHFAARRNRDKIGRRDEMATEILDILVNDGSDVDTRDGSGTTPLSHCACAGHAFTAEFLINMGAEVDSRDKHGMTPLAYSAGRENAFEVSALLIGRGADINSKDKDGQTALHHVLRVGGRTELVWVLNVNQRERMERFQFFLDAGVDTESLSESCMARLLYVANYWGLQEPVKQLIAERASRS